MHFPRRPTHKSCENTEVNTEEKYLSLQTLDQVTNCHTAGDGVWVDNHIRGDALTRERHVLGKKRDKKERGGIQA